VLELQVPDGPALTVRMTSIAEFIEGDVVAVEVDPHQVYVYASGRRPVQARPEP
jgi:hypothetical protein